MTHTPPIPAGNQSPYPLQEPPHKPVSDGPPQGAKVARTPEPQSVSVPTVIALAAGVGLAAVAGGLFYAFSGKKPKRKKRKNKSAQA